MIMLLTKPIISIENVVATGTINQNLDLKDIQKKFPGVIHRVSEPKTVILLFASGKLVCTGGKTEKDVYRSVNNLHSMLEEKNLMIYG